MEKALKAMFEFQRFEQNERLGRLIAQTESRYSRALEDDELWQVNAAGVPEQLCKGKKNPPGTMESAAPEK